MMKRPPTIGARASTTTPAAVYEARRSDCGQMNGRSISQLTSDHTFTAHCFVPGMVSFLWDTSLWSTRRTPSGTAACRACAGDGDETSP